MPTIDLMRLLVDSLKSRSVDPGLCPVDGCHLADDHDHCRCGAVVAINEGTCPDCRAEDDADVRGDEARERAWEREQSGEDVARARLED